MLKHKLSFFFFEEITKQINQILFQRICSKVFLKECIIGILIEYNPHQIFRLVFQG